VIFGSECHGTNVNTRILLSFSVAETNQLMLFTETDPVHCENHAQTHSLGRMQRFSMLKHVVHVDPLCFKGLSLSNVMHIKVNIQVCT
jgi:hypothetical protein